MLETVVQHSHELMLGLDGVLEMTAGWNRSQGDSVMSEVTEDFLMVEGVIGMNCSRRP